AKNLVWRYLVDKNDDAPVDPSEYSANLPQKLHNGDRVHAILVSENPDYKVTGARGITIKISGLKVSAPTTSQTSLMIMLIGGAVVLGGLGAAAYFVVKSKKKRML
ncbi:MAG: hypothetical protein KAG91_00095, partial [Mycoplasmataceae bacterium]|nr:hypothetical protein [Mycoplasmataceae bacterium]